MLRYLNILVYEKILNHSCICFTEHLSTRYDQLINDTNAVLVPSSVYYYYKI
jgi:hypothetical protein